jgi:hypothetical protein
MKRPVDTTNDIYPAKVSHPSFVKFSANRSPAEGAVDRRELETVLSVLFVCYHVYHHTSLFVFPDEIFTPTL